MNIKLPAFIIADLYKNVLISAENFPEINNKITEPEISATKNNAEILPEKFYLGENKKNIIIAVKDNENIFLNDESLHFLNGILAACHFNLADVAIVNFERNNFSFQQLKEMLQLKHIFLFDVSARQIKLPFTIPHYQIQYYDNCTILLAPSLKKLMENSEEIKGEKKKLWSSLKTIFNIE
ncbi:MAG: hypothetical protein ACR2FN_04750 [Chitinophagaceae bacterium]